jgi:hypothetical protein
MPAGVRGLADSHAAMLPSAGSATFAERPRFGSIQLFCDGTKEGSRERAEREPEKLRGFYLYAIIKNGVDLCATKRSLAPVCHQPKLLSPYAIPSQLHPLFTVKSPDMWAQPSLVSEIPLLQRTHAPPPRPASWPHRSSSHRGAHSTDAGACSGSPMPPSAQHRALLHDVVPQPRASAQASREPALAAATARAARPDVDG